jgi:superfamily II DNA helicase RecQ
MADFMRRVLTLAGKKPSTKEPKPPTTPNNGKPTLNGTTSSVRWWRGSGIVYCRKREDCDLVAKILSSAKIPTLSYHAGLGNKERDSVQASWMSNEVPVVAATIAFGMGVDKADVRFVVHWGPPQNLPSYYQGWGSPIRCSISA